MERVMLDDDGFGAADVKLLFSLSFCSFYILFLY